jgi:hypothetical protein
MHSHEINEHRTSNPRVGSSNLSERANRPSRASGVPAHAKTKVYVGKHKGTRLELSLRELSKT